MTEAAKKEALYFILQAATFTVNHLSFTINPSTIPFRKPFLNCVRHLGWDVTTWGNSSGCLTEAWIFYIFDTIRLMHSLEIQPKRVIQQLDQKL